MRSTRRLRVLAAAATLTVGLAGAAACTQSPDVWCGAFATQGYRVVEARRVSATVSRCVERRVGPVGQTDSNTYNVICPSGNGDRLCGRQDLPG